MHFHIERIVNAHFIFAIVSNYVDLPFYSQTFNPDENDCRLSMLINAKLHLRLVKASSKANTCDNPADFIRFSILIHSLNLFFFL